MKETKKPDKPEDADLCFCGSPMEKKNPEDSSSEYVCPNCGALTSTDMADLSAADTQMLNISEMARMAQEGVDPSAVSGEWVTVLDYKPEAKKSGEED